jgi:hypothetical protein
MKNRTLSLTFILLGIITIASLALWTGCSRTDNAPVAPSLSDNDGLTLDNPQIRAVITIQDRHTARLMADKDVIGTAATLDDNGKPAVMILVTTQRAFDAAPKLLDGVPTQVVLTDRIVAMAAHTAKQTPPIQLGTSGGWRYDLANGYCCGGTLGSLVNKGGIQYVMSNYHVLEADIVSGGNGRVATAGDPVIQPGLIDVNCTATNAQNVASLSGIKSLPNYNVDVAIASVISGMVSSTGSILEIGTISATTVAASVGQYVKKSGRTTGLTRSSVSGLNATVSIAYDNECAGGAAFTKTFTGQILVYNKRSKFLAGGDSGSLMVQDVTTNPKAVGLLFAGSTSIAVANPIDQVLSFLGATMVGI